MTKQLPVGVEVSDLTSFQDARGELVEIYREAWLDQPHAVQWTLLRCEGGSMRGVHVHPRQDDYVVPVSGTIWLGVHDLRPGSPTAGTATVVELPCTTPCAATIPRGVAHGFLAIEAATMLVAVNRAYEHGVDELGCRWDDADLGLTWPPIADVTLSDRDRTAGSLAALREQVSQCWSPPGDAEPRSR
jgi:dTDP-4-dehydrorhamnose 3,5-epimerase